MKNTILLLILLFSFFVNAQKAITVTAQLKSSNNELFKANAINSIKQFNSIPNSFFSLVYNPGQRTDGYHTLNVSVHIGDGFADVEFYLNGVDQGAPDSTSGTGASMSFSASYRIGHSPRAAEFSTYELDDFATWSIALSASEISTNYAHEVLGIPMT